MKKITLEHLAVMVKRGFDEMVTKKDIERLATKSEMAGGFAHLEDGLRSITASQCADQADIGELRHRVARLERRAGIGR